MDDGLLALVRLLSLVVLLGPLLWLRRATGIAPGWHPVLVLSGAIVVMLTCGLLGGLRVGVLVVAIGSLALLLREVLLQRRRVVSALTEPAYVVLGLSAVLLAALVHGRSFTHYDNFSHWALVVSVLLEGDSLPSARDTVVEFQSYPLGGAALAYLANRWVGTGEWVSMWAHSLLVVSCALPLVSLAGRRWLVGTGLYAVAAVALLTHVTSPTSLLVDSAVAGLAGALLVLQLLPTNGTRGHLWLGAIMAAALVSMKSSGVLFVAILTVLAGWRAGQSEPGSDSPPVGRVERAAAWALPWLLWGWWTWHVSRAFPAAAQSKNSFSVDRYRTTMGEKSRGDLRAIAEDLLRGFLTDPLLWLLLAAVLVVAAMALRSGDVDVARGRRLLVATLTTVVLWEGSLAVMYVLSMPRREALRLAGFSRYQGTLHLVLMLVLVALVVLWLVGPRTGPTWVPAVGGVATAALVLMMMVSPEKLVRGDDGDLRPQLEAALATTSVGSGDEVCVLLERPDSGYRAWMVRYMLTHEVVRWVEVGADAASVRGQVRDCDLVVLTDKRESTRDLLQEAGLTLPADEGMVVVEP